MSELQLKVKAMRGNERRYSLWFVLVFLATWNAVLRPSSSIPITPFYVSMPFVLIYLLSIKSYYIQRLFFGFIAFSGYGLVIGVTYGVPLSMQLAQLLKYAQLLTFLMMLTWLYRVGPSFDSSLRKLVIILVALVLTIAILQLFTGFEFPTVANEESGVWLNTFFYTPNDLALFLCGVFCIVLCGEYSYWKKIAILVAIFCINLRNDAKAGILASAVMIGTYILLMGCRRFHIKPIFGFLILIILILLMFFYLDDVNIELADSEFNFHQLFIDPLERFYNLDPYNLGGSIYDRTDAFIYSIEALKSMFWLGLGPAGSVYNLSLPNHELLSAKSLHNAIAEIFVEFGPFAILIFCLLLLPLKQALLSEKVSSHQVCLVCFVAASPLLSVSQSSGFISNYAFWLTAFLIWYPTAVGARSINRSPKRGGHLCQPRASA